MKRFIIKTSDFCFRQDKVADFCRMLLIVTVGILAYSNTLHAPFNFDDSANIVKNPLIMNLNLDGLKASFQSRRAIGIITFQLNYYISGWNTLWYHITNIVIHVATALTLYQFHKSIMGTPYVMENSDDDFRSFPLPFFTALLFVVHPVQTQAVTYIVQRFASLATLFYLLSLVSYVNGRRRQEGTLQLFSAGSAGWFAAAAGFTFLAFYTKEIAYTLPLAIILVELLFFRCTLKKVSWLVAGSVSAAAVMLFRYATTQSVQDALSAIDEATRLQTVTSRSDYLLTQFTVIMTYLRLLFMPTNQRIDYDYPLYTSLADWRVLTSLSLIFFLGMFSFWLLKRSAKGAPHLRFAAFGILWFFLTLSVESSIIPIIDLIFEHRLYLPMAGAVTAITSVAMLPGLQNSSGRNAICILFLCLSILLAFATFKRNSVWSSEVSLWSDAVSKSPQSARAWNNLGASYIKQRESLNALKAIIRSIELDPSKADAWNNIGIAIDLMGAYGDRFVRTAEMFREPASIDDKVVNTWLGDVNNNLGLAYEITGNFNKAVENYSNAVGYNPSLTLAYYNLGIVSAKMGNASKYSEQLQILLMFDSSLAQRLRAIVEKGR